MHQDRVSLCFLNKTILITGGTGFVGKVLLEKLLRSCSSLTKIYLLVRTKNNKKPQERLNEITQGPLFDILRKLHGEEIFKKIEAISGDISEKDLALAPCNKAKIINEVEVIYNCAATTRFDDGLKKAVFLNVRGVKLMLELARQCKKLKIFVHLSTAYCHLQERVLFEKPYPPPASADHVITTCEWLDEEVLNKITEAILGDVPNTYAFTKALGEALVNDQMENLPVIILRPSVIIPIWKEPLPGWTDTLNGPTGLLIGAGKGVIRTMYCKGNTYADYVPVDIVVNAILITTFDYITYKKRRIFNITSSDEYKISFEEVVQMGRKIVSKKLPLNGVLWYPGGSMKKSRLSHNIAFLCFQLIPAVILDALLVILGYKPILTRVQKRIAKGYDVFEYYANRQWDFNNDLALQARSNLNPLEKTIYKLDGAGIDYDDYFTSCVHAARLYLLKESDDTIPSAKRHMTMMWCVDIFCKGCIVAGFLYFLWRNLVAPALNLG